MKHRGIYFYLLLLLALALVAALLWLLVLGKKKVSFDTRGGTELAAMYVKKGAALERPMTPVKAGAMFAGWYKDPECSDPWSFETDRVERSMTLYARWR